MGGKRMKPYEEVCFPSGIIRWTRENNLYVCRLTEDQMNEIKEIHETPYTKTYSGGKPNYTQPIVRITTPEDIAKIKSKWEPTIDGWPLWSGLPQPEPVAYINVEERKLEWATPIKWETPTVVKMDKVPLYTKKEWVGLTDEELLDLADMAYANDLELLQTLQAKLKEKNT
jgi:hypothetical protein